MNLKASGIVKRFGHNIVLSGVDFSITDGEIVAVLGENGAGKSTFIRVLTGAHKQDAGQIVIDGRTASFSDTRQSMAAGIHAIYQEVRHNLFPQLSVAENIFMSDGGRFGRLVTDKARMRQDARELLSRIDTRVDPTAHVSDLSVAEQQMVELAKVTAAKCTLLILDEPTAALNREESERLFEQVRRLKAEGTSIVYVSHRLEEVFALADRLVVLRDGRVSTEGATTDFTEEQIVRAMVGRAVDNFYPKEQHRTDAIVMTLRGLSSPAFSSVDLDLHAGEVLGIAGTVGCGRSELLRALFGRYPTSSGTVHIVDRQVQLKSPRAAIRAGVGFISEDRQRDGLCLMRSITSNVTLAAINRFVGLGGLMRTRRERNAARSVIDELQIRATSPEVEVGELSGGNQQKVLFGKWLVYPPTVLLLEEPTRGVDVGAKTEIYRHLNRITANGTGVLLVSSDLPELCQMSDRVLVMRQGAVVAELTGSELTQENVLSHSLAVAA